MKVKITIELEFPGATETPGAASMGTAAVTPPSPGSPPPELEDGPSPAAADCRVSPEPAAQAVNADPPPGVDRHGKNSQGSEVGAIHESCGAPVVRGGYAEADAERAIADAAREGGVTATSHDTTSRPSMQPVIIPDDVAVERMEEARASWESKRRARA